MNTQEDLLKNKNMNNIESNEDNIADEQVAQFAVNLLKNNAQHLNAVTLQRLSEARGSAVSRHTARQGVNHSGNVLQWIASSFEHHRWMSSAIIVGAMMLTFFAAQKLNTDHHLENSDAFLLASELPPEAFADKGFDTWLVSQRD